MPRKPAALDELEDPHYVRQYIQRRLDLLASDAPIGKGSPLGRRERDALLAFVRARRPEVSELRVRTYLSWLPAGAAQLGSRFLEPDRETPARFNEAFTPKRYARGSRVTIAQCLLTFWRWWFEQQGREFPSWLRIRMERWKPVAGPVNVDLASSSAHRLDHNGSNYIHASYQAVTVYAKAPTYVLVPKDNSSLSSLPLGLKRYTAEQNFVLIVVNDTSSDPGQRTVAGIPYPLANGTTSTGTYSVTLQQGLNNFLVPRALFLQTPFGQDALNATITPVQNITGPLGNTVIDQYYNGSQWLARATDGGHNGFNYTGTSGYIDIYSNSSSQNCTGHLSLCGGVPANSNLEAGHQSLAIQAILTLNLSSYGAIADLLAGLTLNRTGNFTSWLFGATQFFPSLGISPNVAVALANSVQSNAGAYPAPTSSGGNWLATWGTAGAVIWNVVSGVAGVVEVFWNAIIAATAFFAYLVNEAASLLLGALHQVATVLKAAAAAALWLLSQLLAAVKYILTSLLNPPVQAFQASLAPLFADMFNGYVLANNSGNGNNPNADSLFLTGIAPLLLASAAIGLVITVAITIALPVEPVLGAVAVFLPLLIASALAASILLPYIGVGTLNMASPTAMLSSAASLASAFLDPGCVGDNAANQTAMLAVILGSSGILVAALIMSRTSSIAIPTLALTFALLSMLFAVASAYPLPGTTTQQIQDGLALSVGFAVLSIGTDVLGLAALAKSLPSLLIVGGVGIGIDLGALYLGLTTRNQACH